MDERAARHHGRAGRTRRRWMVAATGLVLAGSATAAAAGFGVDLNLGAGPGPGGDPVPAAATTTITLPVATTTTAPPPPELPRGGRALFPRYRVVGFYGMQGLDVLGAGPPDVVAERLLEV